MNAALRFYAVTLLCLLSVTGCEQAQTETPDVFSENGMVFSAPYLTFHGEKDKEMGLEFILLFVTMDEHCQSAYIRDGLNTKSFSPGGGGGVIGKAYKHYFIPAGVSPYTIELPLRLTCPQGCKWRLLELWINGHHPFVIYQGIRSPVDMYVASFGSQGNRKPRVPESLPVHCDKVTRDFNKDRLSILYCKYPSRTSQYMSVEREFLQHGGDVKMDITVSDDVQDARKVNRYEPEPAPVYPPVDPGTIEMELKKLPKPFLPGEKKEPVK